MPLDPNIALQVRPFQMESPVNALGQMYQLQGAQQANQMNAMKMAEYERTRQEEEGARNFLNRTDLKTPEARLELATKYGKTGLGYAKTIAEQEAAALKQKVDQLDYTTKVTDAAASIYGTVKDEASWQAAKPKLTALGGDPSKLPETYDPNYVNQEKMAAVKVKDQLTLLAPKPMQVKRADGSIIFLDQNPNSLTFGKEVLPGQATGMTPFQTGELKARQDQLKVSQGQLGVSQGQLKVAQERLAAESATGVLSPESLELAANLYAQTGTLPQLGIGKGAANVKSQIMNRAAQLTMGDGTSAADAATNLAAAKQDTGSRTQAVKAFATGKQGQQVTAFNTAIDHLSTMTKLSDALQNNDIKAFNSLGNTVARQTGQPAPTNFDAAKQIVTAEIIKAVVASGGGVKERQEAENNFAAASSPEQLKGVINTYKQLLGGQLNSLNLQYENSTGRKDFDKKLTPDAKAELNKLRGTETPPAAAATGSWSVVR
jgi:hypothetical protein